MSRGPTPRHPPCWRSWRCWSCGADVGEPCAGLPGDRVHAGRDSLIESLVRLGTTEEAATKLALATSVVAVWHRSVETGGWWRPGLAADELQAVMGAGVLSEENVQRLVQLDALALLEGTAGNSAIRRPIPRGPRPHT